MNPRQAPVHVIALLVSAGVLASVGLGGLAAATTSSPMSVASSCPNPDAPPTTSAIVKTLPLGSPPQVVAVDDEDDTVYVGTQSAGLVVVDGRSGDEVATIPVGSPVQGVAVDQVDDTVYFTEEGFAGDDTLWVINGRNTSTSPYPIPVGNNPAGVAVDQDDDTVYVANSDGATLSVIRGADDSVVRTIPVGTGPQGVAVHDADDTVYVANSGASSPTLSIIPRGAVTATTSPDLPSFNNPFGVAVDQSDDTVYISSRADSGIWIVSGIVDDTVPLLLPAEGTRGIAVNQTDDTVYVATVRSAAGWISIINGRTGQLLDDTIDTIVVSQTTQGVAVDQVGPNAGLLYVANTLDLLVIADVLPSLTPNSGLAGTPLTITVDAPQVSYNIDDTTVSLVCFGSTPVTFTPATEDTWTTAAPAGAPGTTVPVTAVFDGGLTARVGSFTYNSAPTPVASPPGPPGDVSAVAGDASAVVSWRMPQDQGSYPVTNYEVTSSPAGGTCLTKAPATTCEITGLVNGVAYSFRARALNGAGWGSPSAASAPVTPRADRSLVITGARDAADARYIRVSGTAIGMAGERVTPWIRFPGQTSYAAGTSRPTVSPDGTFTWQRLSAKKTYVYFTGESIRSNRVIIPARQRLN